jgi:hypothetical protein
MLPWKHVERVYYLFGQYVNTVISTEAFFFWGGVLLSYRKWCDHVSHAFRPAPAN